MSKDIPFAAVYVDSDSLSGEGSSRPDANFSSGPQCVTRMLAAFTANGWLRLGGVTSGKLFDTGTKVRLQRFSKEAALKQLKDAALADYEKHGAPPDFALMVACGARGVALYDEEGVE